MQRASTVLALSLAASAAWAAPPEGPPYPEPRSSEVPAAESPALPRAVSPSAAVPTPEGSVGETSLPRLPHSVSIDVKDAEVANVLRLFADVGQVNLVVSDAVKGKVTVRLHGVDWREAFGVVLKQHQLGMERNGTVISVDTLARLTDRAERRARLTTARQELAPLKTVLIPVRYAKAKELEPIVRSLLTGRGTVAVDQRSNTLIVTDVHADDIRDRLSL